MDTTLELGALITLIITNIVSPVITWMMAKKKYYTEVDSNWIENMQKSLEFYKNICEDNREQLAAMRAEHAAYKEAREREADQLRGEIKELKAEQLAMYQLMCMDLPCQFRQPYLSRNGEMFEMPSEELKKKVKELHEQRNTKTPKSSHKTKTGSKEAKPKEDKKE